MKRVLVSSGLSLALLTAAIVPRVEAGQGEWATAGKILTAVAAVSIISKAMEPVPVYQAPPVYYVPQPVAPVVYQQPVVYPAPVVYPQVVAAPPVVVVPAPVYYVPRPVYYAPRPFVGIHFGSGHHHGHRQYHSRGGW